MKIPSNILQLAKDTAKKSKHSYRVGTVIFRRKEIISTGCNNPNRSVRSITSRFVRWPNSIHSEVVAIINAKKDLKGCNMLVIRLNSKGELKLAKPCKHCLAYIDYVKIKRVFYSDNDGKVVEL